MKLLPGKLTPAKTSIIEIKHDQYNGLNWNALFLSCIFYGWFNNSSCINTFVLRNVTLLVQQTMPVKSKTTNLTLSTTERNIKMWLLISTAIVFGEILVLLHHYIGVSHLKLLTIKPSLLHKD